MKTDRRKIYTQTIIRQAFMQLLKEQIVEKITVTEICRLAEINRATFYRHYENQYDLLSCLETEMFEEIKKSTYSCGNNIDKLTETILCKFYEQKESWTLLLSDHANLSFQSKIYAFFEEYFNKESKSKQSEFKYRFLLYGYSGLIDNWAKSGMKETPKKMAGYLNSIRQELIKNKQNKSTAF